MEEQSRNSWVNIDEPTDVSSMVRHKDGYEDLLDSRQGKSDLLYSFRNRPGVPSYKYTHPRTPAQIKEDVLTSDRVKYGIEMLSQQTGQPQEAVRTEAIAILDEMAHNLNMGGIRFFAYFLIKIFKTLFRRIYVNEEGVQQLHRLVHEYPVLLMPTHRSYMDFLLVSYIFYQHNLPLPVIAAAMDFKGMKFFGWLLRNCGAFYIRRSFGTDQLYWAVFTEYVQTQLRNGDSPLEFFVEGTRSRTAKSYVPRIGMLSAALESYFKAEVPDIMIVPISISYDRILEESLYAFELLGVPKPKESASGVFKARKILSEDFGSIHFHIDEAISIRNFSTGKIDRIFHAQEPRYINNLTEDEAKLTQQLAFRIVRQQQRNMVISPWALMAAVLMQSREGIALWQLVKETEWLKRQAANLGAYVDWPGNASLESVIRHYLSIHPNIVSISPEDIVELRLEAPSGGKLPLRDSVMLNAAVHLMLASYRNQLLHVFVRAGMVALTVNGCFCNQDVLLVSELYERYSFLERLFSRDFVFQPGHTKQDFEQAMLVLRHSGGLAVQDGQVQIRKSINKHTTFLSQMFEPFLLGYWILCQHLLSLNGDVHGRPLPKKPKALAADAQQLGVRLLQEGIIKHYEVLSLDLLGNGLTALTELGTMFKDKRNEEPYLSPKRLAVSRVADEIGKFIELPSVTMSDFTSSEKNVVMSAKL